MQLKQLVQNFQPVKVDGTLSREVHGITWDYRRVGAGMVFVALSGGKEDGHEHIDTAIARGAVAVVCERRSSIKQRATRIQVANSRTALAHLACRYYHDPSSKLKVIGVAGTHGKSNVAYLLKQLLEAANIETGLISSLQYEIGRRILPGQCRTPEASELQQMMAQMVKSGCKVCVIELEPEVLMHQQAMGVHFDSIICTNFHYSDGKQDGPFDPATLRNLAKIISAPAKGDRRSCHIINIDDDFGGHLANSPEVEINLTYGLDHRAAIRAVAPQLRHNGTGFRLDTPDGSSWCSIPLVGRTNLYHLLAAVGVVKQLGVSPEALAQALNKLQSAPGQLEAVTHSAPITCFVDSARDPQSLKEALRSLREVATGRIGLVFGCEGGSTTELRESMGRVAAEETDFTIITSDNPRRESSQVIADQITGGFALVRKFGVTTELDRSKAIQRGVEWARPGDVLLVAGKGHQTFQEFDDTVVPFDDRVFLQENLDERFQPGLQNI